VSSEALNSVPIRMTSRQRAELKRAANDSAMSLEAFVLARLGLLAGICRVCGCTEQSGCADGCEWTSADRTLCSRCRDDLEGRDQWALLGLLFSEAPSDG
jgi:hypothetical protein